MTGERSSWAAHRTDRAYHKGVRMIPKGLKVGQTYLEGDLVYKVTEVLGDGRYVGSWTGEIQSSPSVSPKAEVKKEVKEEVKEEVKDDSVDYLSMQYAQLKKLCAERGLDAKGSKSELIARLEK